MRILMSMFGWADSGGGTIFPRQLALELQRRGHQVMVIYAGVPQIAQAPAYAIHEHTEDGVHLTGIHNRPALFLDDQAPRREIHDPEIVRIFQHYFMSFQPDLVHYHNFLGLSLGIAEIARAAGIPSFYTPYNFWLLCPTLYLNLPNLALCRGVSPSGNNCLNCTQARIAGSEYLARRDVLRADYVRMVGPCLATSENVRELLLENGYPADKIEILKLGNDRSQRIWESVGRQRQPEVTMPLRIGFMGSLLAIKGVHTLVAAAQLLTGEFKISLHGEGPEDYLKSLRALDTKGIIDFAGRFADAEHGQILSQLHLGVVPSICYDHSPLVIGEFQAARIPVVGARIGGIPDYIQPGTGALFEAGQVSDLARRLQALIDDPSPILAWQQAMLPPVSFENYIDTLIGRYQEVRQQSRRQSQSLQIERFLRTRSQQVLYHAENLLPVPEATGPFGMDLSSPEQLQQHADLLLQARWAVTPNLQMLEQIRQRAPKLPVALIGGWCGPRPAAEIALPTDKQYRVLMPLAASAGDWQAPVIAWARHLNADADASLVLLPWQSSAETCQEGLFNLLESLDQDPDTSAEMILLEEAGSDLASLAPNFDLVLLTPDLCQIPQLIWAALTAPALLLASPLPEAVGLPEALWHPLNPPPVIQPWLEALQTYQLRSVDQQILKKQFETQQQSMQALLEELDHSTSG